MAFLKRKLSQYWKLIKSLQTGLLLATGLAGYLSARCPFNNLTSVLSVTASLFLAISGSTVLNMWYDRDIDARMRRTCCRPLASGEASEKEALVLGSILAAAGVSWAVLINPLYGGIVFAGLFFDMVVYTVWLKRRSCWSIVWGGISGGMPVLAGRTLATGHLDWIGITLSLGILFWIPTHIMTFSMRYHDDYQAAGIPTFPSRYGFQFTRVVIAVSSVMAALAMGLSSLGLGMQWGYMRLLIVLSAGLLALAVISTVRPSERINLGLFKYASVYMLGSMILMMI